jgi:hypothetical protein
VSRSSAPNTPTSTSSSPTSCNGGNGKHFESLKMAVDYKKHSRIL